MSVNTEHEELPKKYTHGVVLHGGGGVRRTKEMTPEIEDAYRSKLKEALFAGYELLEQGESSVSAVEATIRVMEDSPLFNAGKGAAFTSAGINEMDACIMNGKTLRAGGVANVKFVKNPINLARLVMEETPHVLLVSEGAGLFAKEQGVILKPTEYFYTERQWESLQRRLKESVPYGGQLPETDEEKFGTVGAVALDKAGNLAAGTSTGGRVKKRPGRVGDSPIIGASTYANNDTCAVSTTGLGEVHMVVLTSKEISALIAYKGMSLKEAAYDVIMNQVAALGGGGGAIAIDKNGNVAMPFLGEGMFRGYMRPDEKMVVKIFED